MEDLILEKLSIIIEIMMKILDCSYSEAYEIITKSETYYFLQQRDYSTLHDSPQANLSSIGEELRQKNIAIGYKLTDDGIRDAVWAMRQKNLKKQN